MSDNKDLLYICMWNHMVAGKKKKNQIEFSTESIASEVYRTNILFCFLRYANITHASKKMTNYLTKIQNLLYTRHSS